MWLAGIAAAVASLVRARTLREIRNALRLVLCPIDLWRYFETTVVLDSLTANGPILDIGSPKVVAELVRQRVSAAIVCSDIAREALPRSRAGIRSLQCDAKHLPFADASISFVFSVSAVEHIAGEGDRAAVREIARVLTSGGIAVITVPLVATYIERWIDADPYGKQARDSEGRVFFSRYYDWQTLIDRIASADRLRIRNMFAWQEKRAGWYEGYCRATERPVSLRSVITKLFDGIWAAYRIEPVTGGAEYVTRHGIAALVLEKD